MTLGIECLLTDDPQRAAAAGAATRRASTASGARSRPACASRPRRCSNTCCARPPQPHRRPRCRCSTANSTKAWSASSPARLKDRLHRPTFVFARGAGWRAEGLGPLDRRLSPARRARPRRQAPPRRAAALRRPRHGSWLHAGRSAFRCLRPGAAARGGRMARRCDADATHAHRRRRWRWSTSTSRRWPALDAQVWGQAFEAPLFCDEVRGAVAAAGRREAPEAAACATPGQPRDAIWFGHAEPVAERVRLAYRVALDEYNGRQRLQMVVEAAMPL